jgi:hypothetical protein
MPQIKEVSFEDKQLSIVLKMCKEANLSVSSVKYHEGHDGYGLTCNLKIGNKIVGTLYDDGWGGGFVTRDKSETVKVKPFDEAIQGIMAKAPKYKSESLGSELSYSYDMIVNTMVNDFNLRKDCKNKILVKATKIDDDNARVDTFTFNIPFDGTMSQTAQVAKSMEKDGYVKFEIVNKRLF